MPYNYQLREVENIRLEKANARMYAIVVIACLVALALVLLSLALLQYHRHRRIRMKMQMERLKQIKGKHLQEKSGVYRQQQTQNSGTGAPAGDDGQENEELKTKLQNERSRLISENEIAEIENRESELAYGRIVKTEVFRRFNSLSSSEHAMNPTAEDWAELRKSRERRVSRFHRKAD